MKYTCCFFLFFTFFITTILAQQDHFLYFQTEANQAFYVKLENKVFNSSSAGYLILPKLREGNYRLIFGFPKNEWPEEAVIYTVDRDAGFILKNFPDKGWGLFNLQSLNVIMPGEKLAKSITVNNVTGDLKKDNFSEMLAAVVNDSTIKQKDIVVKKEADQIPKQEITTTEPADPVKAVPSSRATSFNALYSVITKGLPVKNKRGAEMVYIDEYDNNKDTIKVFIPKESIREIAERKKRAIDSSKGENKNVPAKPTAINSQIDTAESIKEPPVADSSAVKEVKNDAIIIAADSNKIMNGQKPVNQLPLTEQEHSTESLTADSTANALQKLVDNSTPFKEQKNDTAIAIADTSKNMRDENKIEFLPPKTGMINSNCRQYANEDDFLKLRKKMAGENSDDDMIMAAKKVFRSKCFSVKGIKNLSALFLSDEGKYSFFDAAYPYVSDSDNFYTLQNQLSDAYYVKRFEAMIHH